MTNPDPSPPAAAEAGEAAQRSITSFWQIVAPHYDSPENVARPGTDGYQDWTRAIRSVLPDPPARVLDVGTGTGFVARIAAELGHAVTAIDLSEAMLDASTASDPGISFSIGDAVDPPFEAESFDVVINRSLLWTLREPARAFTNWHALLAPGGRAICIYGIRPETTSPPSPPDEPRAEIFSRHYTSAVQAQLPAMHLHDHEPAIQWATTAGFDNVEAVALEPVADWEASPGAFQPYALLAHRH